MACLGDLPELVVINIFSYLHYYDSESISNLKKRMPLIAINSNWRRCGLYLLYRMLIFDFRVVEMEPQPTEHVNNKGIYCCSNIKLFKRTKYFKLVIGLKIDRNDNYTELPGLNDVLRLVIRVLLSVIPRDVSNNTIRSIDKLLVDAKHLGKSAGTLVYDVVEELYQMFPNIRHLDIILETFRNDLDYFAKALTKPKFHGPLLFYRYGPPRKVKYSTCPNMDIKNVVWGHRDLVVMTLHVSCGIEKLESLRILNPACIFSWHELKQRSKTIVFPKLHKLILDCWYCFERSIITAEAEEHSRLALPEFPALRYLKIHISNEYGIEFVPAVIPTHLEKVVLSGNALAITTFAKLPVKSIGYLEVHLSKDFGLVSDEFYTATNRLFTDIKITHSTNVILRDSMVNLDLQKIRWQHIDKLELGDADLDQIFNWIDKLPTLRSLKTVFGYYRADPDRFWMERRICRGLQNSQLRVLRVDEDTNIGRQYVEEAAMYLIKALKNLEYVYLPKYLVHSVRGIMAARKYKYQHFNNIDICGGL